MTFHCTQCSNFAYYHGSECLKIFAVKYDAPAQNKRALCLSTAPGQQWMQGRPPIVRKKLQPIQPWKRWKNLVPFRI